MKKRIWSLLLSLCLIVALFPANVSAAGSLTVTDAESLKTAIAAGGQVVLGADITITEKLEIAKDTVIDGGNFTLTYTGSDRAITVENTANDTVDLTIQNLTVDCTASYCQRGINYNEEGNLTLTNVTVKGTGITYALNLPGSSIGANVTIQGGSYTGCIALNIWGKNSTVTATDAVFTSVDKAAVEDYCAIALNNDGTTIAEGAKVTINGGKVIAYKEDGTTPSFASRNATATGTIQISNTTEVVGSNKDTIEAIIQYPNTTDFYSISKLQDAINKVIADGAGSVKMLKDVTLSEILTINGPVVLDGNGHKITSTATRGINVDTDGEVTIKNLTIEASGERAFNIIKPATLKIESVKATAANYVVNITSSGGAANVTVTDSDFTGLNVVNVWGLGANVNITNTKLNCVDQTEAESYAAIMMNSTADGAKVTFTSGAQGGIFVEGDSCEAYSVNPNATIVINNNSDGTEHAVAIIDYNNGYKYAFTKLANAVAKAVAGETITLVDNVNESAAILVDKSITIADNSKNITATFKLAEGVTLTAKEGLTVTSNVPGYKVAYASGKYGLVTCDHNGTIVTDAAVAATCSGTGLTEGKHCSVCGQVTVAQNTIPATGHNFSDWFYSPEAPTCLKDGTEVRVCSCGAAESHVAPATGHSYNANGACTVCGVYDASKVTATPAPTKAPVAVTPSPTKAPAATAAPTATPAPTAAPTKAPAPAATPAPTAPAVEMPKEADTTITEVTANTAVVEVIKESVAVVEGTAALDATVVEAIVEATAEEEAVVLALTETTDEAVEKAEVNTEALAKVAEAQKDVVIEFTDIKVKLDAAAVQAITEQAQGEAIEIRAVKVAEHVLTEEQQKVLAEKETAVIVTAQIFSNGEYIGDFKGGKATIMLPFTPDEDKDAGDYAVYYIAENGDLIEVAAEYVDGHMVFTTAHFSDYVIVYEGAGMGTVGIGSADAAAPVNSLYIVFAIAAVIAIAAIVGAVVLAKKKKTQN